MRYGQKTQTLKVPISVLLANATAARERMVAEHRKAAESYPERWQTYCEAVVAALESAVSQARSGNPKLVPDTDYNGRVQVKPRNRLPQRPEKTTLDTKGIDRDIRLLEQTSQETTTVSTDSNWAAYI